MKNIIMDLCRGNIEAETLSDTTLKKLKELEDLKEKNYNNKISTFALKISNFIEKTYNYVKI